MALRVLLADESSTIKKVMQLALSDFGVEVKSVPVGLDVLQVTKTFKPDIVFADVLLTKRSGYEVCADLKNDAETSHIPVVLMWSGFMEIDEAKATECRADRRLEKPFDADHLRSIVSELVQKTKSNPVSSFLTFPEMPEFEETPAENAPAAEQEVYAIPEEKSDFLNIPEIDADEANLLEVSGEEFSAVPLTNPKAEDEHDEGGWAHQDLTKFKIQIPETDSSDFASKFVIPQDDDLSGAHIEMDGDFEEISFVKSTPEVTKTKAPSTAADSFISNVEKSVKDQMMETLKKGATKSTATGAAPQPASNAKPNTQSKMDLDPNMMEKIIREEAREVIESICWKVLPEIAERIVREEIKKILRETEKSI